MKKNVRENKNLTSTHRRALDWRSSSMSTNKLTLIYLPLRSRTEGIQLVLRAGNIDYEMVYCPFKEWATLKPDPEYSN